MMPTVAVETVSRKLLLLEFTEKASAFCADAISRIARTDFRNMLM